ncbi:MAG: hypothetical protein J5706_08705 [Elusimicrobiales bacterium]|nr:hypothetical protein [Elusimicrobiales bacterium]
MIKNILSALAFAIMFSMPFLQPQNLYAADSMAALNELYRSENYEEAYKGYADALSKDIRNPGLWYNAGNALFRLNRHGDAVYAYLRAFMLAPRDPDIRFNLEYSMRVTGQPFVPEGTPKAFYLMFYFLSGQELKAFMLLLFWAGMAAACAALKLDGKMKTYMIRTFISVFLMLAMCGGWAWARHYSLFSSSSAVITAPGGIKLLSGPGENFRECASAPEGRIVRILNSADDNYYEIGLDAEGISGWAIKTGVKKI